MENMKSFELITNDKVPVELLDQSLDDPRCGGIATFVGKVRNHHHGKEVIGLEYEAYKPMAEKMILGIITDAKQQFGVHDVKVMHRVGRLEIGDVAVWIGVQSAHRKDAFKACSYAIDELKKRAPIWKREFYSDNQEQWIESCC